MSPAARGAASFFASVLAFLVAGGSLTAPAARLGRWASLAELFQRGTFSKQLVPQITTKRLRSNGDEL